MTASLSLLFAEVPVVTAASLAAMGYMLRRAERRADERDRQIAAMAQGLALVTQRVDIMDTSVQSHDRRFVPVTENLSTVAAFMDRHERWHERHETPQQRAAGA